jgi:hypothetical protein
LRCAEKGELFLSDELKVSQTESWVKDGIQQLGLLHDAEVVKVQQDVIWTEDMNLLYYYRNRLAGYGLSRLAEIERDKAVLRQNDSQGFLA